MAKLRMNQAINQALFDEMTANDRVIVLGEDVGENGGAFKTSVGLLDTFGPKRVLDTPISEMGFTGAALGASLTGIRPVVDMVFVEFMGVALDQIVTQASMMHHLSGGKLDAPIVYRASNGAGLAFGCQHSQTLERWFFGTPGIKIVVPSGARTAYGLLRAAIRDNDPVVFLEARPYYGQREEFTPGDDAIMEIGKAEIVAVGQDITIVTLGQTVAIAAEAAASSNWSAEIIDLLTLAPWDVGTVLKSVQKTGRLAIVEENQYTGGWGGQIAAHVIERAFHHLKAPVIRITAPDCPVPFGQHLEARYMPSSTYVAEQIGTLLSTGKAALPWWEGKEE
jgi:pyruvate dehydrogenase E1 component beta subunit